VVMAFDIGDLHAKGREWKVGKRRSRGLLLKTDRKGRETGREERVIKGKGVVCPNNKNSFPRPGQ